MTTELLTVNEWVTRFKRSRSTAYRRLANGQLAGTKVGRRWLIEVKVEAPKPSFTAGAPSSVLSLVARGCLALRGY